jgi:hypothetical protein
VAGACNPVTWGQRKVELALWGLTGLGLSTLSERPGQEPRRQAPMGGVLRVLVEE